MKELTTEQIQIAAANYRLARQHMTYLQNQIIFKERKNY